MRQELHQDDSNRPVWFWSGYRDGLALYIPGG